MSKFDRCIFISIAIGIWALAMVQMFKPEILQAGYNGLVGHHPFVRLHMVVGKCPDGISMMPADSLKNSDRCDYLLTASYDDMLKHPEYFK